MNIKQEILDSVNESPFIPIKLITLLKRIDGLENQYLSKVRHYTLEKHSLLVLTEFERHFTSFNLPISRGLFRIFLCIHDIGKPIALARGNINDQHLYSIKIINKISDSLPLNNSEITLCNVLIMNDPIGLYFQNRVSIEEASVIILESSRKTNLSIKDYLRLLTIYYQADTASYTLDAGGFPYLEHIFQYENGSKTYNLARGLLQFSPNFEKKYLLLEKAIIQ